MALYGIETVLGDIVSALKAGMASKAVSLNSEYGDSVTIAAPDSATGYWAEVRPPKVAERLSLSLPGFIVFPLEDMPEAQPMGQYETAYSLAVCPVVRSATVHEMSLRLFRYVRAAKEVLCAPGQVASGKCSWVGTDWRERELDIPDADYTLQARVCGFQVVTYESL